MTERIIPIASHYEEVATRGMKQTDLERLKKMLVKLFLEYACVRQGIGRAAAHEIRAPSVATFYAAAVSAIGPKQTSLVATRMSAFGGKADIVWTCRNVCL